MALKKKHNPHIGSSPDEFLKEEGILAESRAAAIEEAIARQLEQATRTEGIT